MSGGSRNVGLPRRVMSQHRAIVGLWPLLLVLAPLLAAFVATFFTLVALDPSAFEQTGRASAEAMVAFGIKDDARVAAGHLAGLVRAGLVHHSWTHLALNSLGLGLFSLLSWRLVPPEDRTIGRATAILAVAVVSAVGGFVLSFLVGNGLSAGASGAVFGVLGALPLALVVRADLGPPRLRWGLAAMLMALGALGVALLSGGGGVDHAAHLGGLLTGVPLGYAQARRAGRLGLIVAALALIAIGFLPA